MGKSLYPPGATFCRHCGYCLHALVVNRCPECGREFDPGNPASFRRRPPRTWLRRVLLWGGGLVLLLVLCHAGLLGWLYWGYRQEAAARTLVNPPHPPLNMGDQVIYWPADIARTEPILPASLRWAVLPACRPWMERITEMRLIREYSDNMPDVAGPLARCHRLTKLSLTSIRLRRQDVEALTTITGLAELSLRGNDLTSGDVTSLGRLSRLQKLTLNQTPLFSRPLDEQVVAPIGRLQRLESLTLEADLSEGALDTLAGLPQLTELHLSRCPRLTDADVPKISRLTGLRKLWLQRTGITAEGMRQLRSAMPQCKIEGP